MKPSKTGNYITKAILNDVVDVAVVCCFFNIIVFLCVFYEMTFVVKLWWLEVTEQEAENIVVLLRSIPFWWMDLR